MRHILITFLFISNISEAQIYIAKAENGADQAIAIQAAFNLKDTRTVLINSGDININGIVTIPAGKTLKFENGYRLTGHGTINGGKIEADYQSQLFDTSLTVNLQSVNEYFSVKWFGAKGNNTDDYPAIQKTINTCIRSNIRTVYFPVGRYRISRPLVIRGTATAGEDNNKNDRRSFCTVELLGQSSFWDSNLGSEIYTTFNNAFAIGIQNGKGCKIRKLRISGLFTPPVFNDTHKFYSMSFESFTDDKCRDSRYSPYAGIVIDPFTNLETSPMPADGGYPGMQEYYGKSGRLSTQSGSTGVELEELNIQGFVVGICSSPNGLTRNAEITIINKVQFSNCKLCVSGGQDQEKENTISNIYCWGGTHTIFATGLYGSPRMAGNWHIDHVNIAGGIVRFIYNDQHGYFPTFISHVFAESLGSFGTLNSELACEVSDCIFDFAYQSLAGEQTLLTANGENVVFRSCNFRYYGEKTPLLMQGNCVFEHCYFSGPVIKNKSGSFDDIFSVKDVFGTTIVLMAMPLLLTFLAVLFIFYYRRQIFWKIYYSDKPQTRMVKRNWLS
ncbi:MAG: glycosyl hydrolase family 28-related protein [Ginsengibacter sp.]